MTFYKKWRVVRGTKNEEEFGLGKNVYKKGNLKLEKIIKMVA